MEKKNVLTKTANYQLLDSYQTNSPIYTSEENIRSYIVEEYANALFKFALLLQKLFAFEAEFNKPELANRQQQRIKCLYNECFCNYSAQDREEMFYYLLFHLIGGLNCDFNFAYGIKLYSLFKEELGLDDSCKTLFSSRIRLNILSKYYMDHPEESTISESELLEVLDKTLSNKLSRYKMFNQESAF